MKSLKISQADQRWCYMAREGAHAPQKFASGKHHCYHTAQVSLQRITHSLAPSPPGVDIYCCIPNTGLAETHRPPRPSKARKGSNQGILSLDKPATKARELPCAKQAAKHARQAQVSGTELHNSCCVISGICTASLIIFGHPYPPSR